jgi:hypothetical protein
MACNGKGLLVAGPEQVLRKSPELNQAKQGAEHGIAVIRHKQLYHDSWVMGLCGFYRGNVIKRTHLITLANIILLIMTRTQDSFIYGIFERQ